VIRALRCERQVAGTKERLNTIMRNITRRTILLLCICAVLPVSSAAAVGDGGTRSIFSLGADARGIALGRSFVSLADDAGAIYWNPAALRNVESKQIMGTYMPLFGDFSDATYTYFGAVYPTLNAGSFGIGFMRISDSFKGFDSGGAPTKDGEYSESQFLIGYAAERHWRYLLGSLATGVSFKISNVNVSPHSSTAPGIDVGFRYIPDYARSFSVGVNFQDISGAEHKLVETTDRTFRTILAGVGYTRVFANGSALRVMLQMDAPEVADREFHIGAEYSMARYLAFRLGMDDGGFTFGLGVTYTGFGLDYASFSRDEAGSSRPISFSTRYGSTLHEQRQMLSERRAADEQELIKQTFEARVTEHRVLAQQYEIEGDIPMAIDEWKIVVEYMPGDSEATNHLALAQRRLVEQQARANRDLEEQTRISTHYSQGLKFYSENDYARARDEWQEVLRLAPDHTEARDYLARTQEKIDEIVQSRISTARAYEQDGRLTEAIGEWNNIVLLDPDNRNASGAIASLRTKIDAQTKDYATASRKLRVVELYNQALLKYNRGEYESTITDLNSLLSSDSAHAEAKNLLLMAQRKLTPLSTEEEENIRRLYLKGMQYFSKDQYKEAITEWEKILKIDPSNESVKKNIQEAKDRQKKLGTNSG
jgi:tetratricopeptide (TPR) repeat protein